MSRCFPYPPPGYEKGTNLGLSNGEGEAREPQFEVELELGYPDKSAQNTKDKDKMEKKKKRKEKNKDEHGLDAEKSEKKHKHKHQKHKKDKNSDNDKQKNKDDIDNDKQKNGGHAFEDKNGVLARDKNGGHAFEDKNGVVDAKDILNKEEPESFKFSENIENGKYSKIYQSETESSVQKVDKQRKSEVELRKFAAIDRLVNGKCDMIEFSDKDCSRQKLDKNKQLELESKKPPMIESLKNGKHNSTDLSNREGSWQKVDKDKKLKSNKFAGTERHENGICNKVDPSGRETLRKLVEKDKKLEVELKHSAGIERLMDGKCDKNGGHAFEDKNGVVDEKDILNKEEPESRKFSENIENGKFSKIYPSETESQVQKVDKKRKSEVELRKFSAIDRPVNGKCDMIGLLDKDCSRQKVDKNKQLELDSKKPPVIESLKNGKHNSTDLSNREGSWQKVDKDKKLKPNKFAGTERHENGKCNKIYLPGREALRKQVEKDKKLEVYLKHSAGIERLMDGKCDKNGGHAFEDKNGVVDAKDILNKEEPESLKFSENIENGKFGKIYPSDTESQVQKVDKKRKSEVELRKFAAIDRPVNGKCDMIDVSDKDCSRQKVDKNKQLELESKKPPVIESLKNGKHNSTDLSNREVSWQKVEKDKKLKSNTFAGTEWHENGKCNKIYLSGKEALRKQVEKDKKLEVELKHSAGIERLKDGKCDKIDLSDGEGFMQQVNKHKNLTLEMMKSDEIERHQNGKCDKIDLSARQSYRQNMDKDKKLEVELKKCAGIGRLENGKCDKIGKSDREGYRQKVDKGMTRDNGMERDQKILKDRAKSNVIGKKRKEMDTTLSSHVESIEILENGNHKKIDQLDRQGSRQKVIKETVRDNEIARDKENFKDFSKSSDIRKKRKEMDTTSPSHGNGLWINLPVLTDKEKRSIKRPRIETTGDVYCGNGTTVQEAKDRALGCVYDNGVQEGSKAAVDKCIASACHPPVATKECEQNGKVDCKTISHTSGPSYCNAEAVDAIPSMARVDNHVQDFNYFHSVPPKLDWSNVDDQAWLFHSNCSKPKAAVKIDHGLNVWAQALHLQPDIYAWPYVSHL